MLDEATRAQIGGAVIALLLALLARVRARAKSGKRILPRVRVRASFSIQSPESDPPPAAEPFAEDESTPVVVRRKRRHAEDEQDDG